MISRQTLRRFAPIGLVISGLAALSAFVLYTSTAVLNSPSRSAWVSSFSVMRLRPARTRKRLAKSSRTPGPERKQLAHADIAYWYPRCIKLVVITIHNNGD